MTALKYSSEHNVVYSIEHLSGAVTQHDAETGTTNWRMECASMTINPICQDSVEADFSISDDGLTVYFGDVYGRINAVRFPPPQTEMPSSAPSESPSAAPSESPSAAPSTVPSVEPSEVPSSTPSSSPSLEPSELVSDMPSSESPPTVAKEQRGTGSSSGGGDGQDAEPWEESNLTPFMSTSAAWKQGLLAAALVHAVAVLAPLYA